MMYDLTTFRNWLVGQLYTTYKTPIVPNDDSPRPPKPFFAYTFTSLYIPQAAPAVIEYSDVVKVIPPPPVDEGDEPPENEEEKEPTVEHWSRKRRTEHPTVVISFTAVAATMQSCFDNILALRRWFALDGKSALKSQNVVVARVEAVQDRSTILGDTVAEYRAGFDVVLRVYSQISIDIEQIEAVSVNDTEYRVNEESDDN